MTEYLLEQSPDTVNAQTKAGHTAVHYAAARDDLQTLQVKEATGAQRRVLELLSFVTTGSEFLCKAWGLPDCVHNRTGLGVEPFREFHTGPVAMCPCGNQVCPKSPIGLQNRIRLDWAWSFFVKFTPARWQCVFVVIKSARKHPSASTIPDWTDSPTP